VRKRGAKRESSQFLGSRLLCERLAFQLGNRRDDPEFAEERKDERGRADARRRPVDGVEGSKEVGIGRYPLETPVFPSVTR
jgi:hypothetical protein